MSADGIISGKTKEDLLAELPGFAPPGVAPYHHHLAKLAVLTASDVQAAIHNLKVAIMRSEEHLSSVITASNAAITASNAANERLAKVGIWMTGVLAFATVFIAIGTAILAFR